MTTKTVLIEVEVPENWPTDRIVGADPGVLAVKHLGAFPSHLIPPARAVPDELPNLPFAILPEEMKALERFHECAMDGEGYDVPKDMMHKLAEIGLVRRAFGNYYKHTTFGLAVLNGDFSPPAEPARAAGDEKLRNASRWLRNMSNHSAWKGGFGDSRKPAEFIEVADILDALLAAAPVEPSAEKGDGV